MEEEKLQNPQNADGNAGQQKRRKGILRAVIVAVALLFAAAVFATGFAVGRGNLTKRERSLLDMARLVEENYREEVDRDALFDRMYDALEMDKFCTHFTPEESAADLREGEGEYEGYGISLIAELTAGETRVRVHRVAFNSPVELSGIRKGMYVCGYGDGKVPAGSSEVIDYLTAAEGDAVLLCGFEPDGSDAQSYTLRRAGYRAAYCAYSDSGTEFRFRGAGKLSLTETGGGMKALPADTAYIAFTQFEGDAAGQFRTCLAKMRERGRKNLIIDLRGNGGGYLSVLCDISSSLMRNAEGRKPLVVTARYRDGKEQRYYAAGNDFGTYFDEDARISVLADENTASASEALMGVLHDYGTCDYADFFIRMSDGRAHTYGKGVMQSRFTVEDGNAMLLTVATLYWPQGNCIHGEDKGISSADGATAVDAPAYPSASDEFLLQVCGMLT